MANRKINIAELEFDQIKQNLKAFLQGQEQFQDYDFDGSNMSVLLDVLAYNTHYNAMYMNMAMNEAYLDSASRRDSVVSLAKSLGYVPRSYICARANISFTVSGISDPSILTLTAERNTIFYGTRDAVRYSFYMTSSKSTSRTPSGTFVFEDIEVVEGAPIATRFDYTEQNSFVLPNTNIDTTTLVVRVQSTPTSTSYDTYVNASTVATVSATSKVFFLRETDGGFYEMSFGDDIVGRALSVGNVINADYFVCSGDSPNGISALFYGGSQFAGGSVTSLQLNGQSVNGGRAPETIEEIRFNAPNFYQSQNRAVTALDYESIILSKIPSIRAVSVWGGENNDPPMFGKVFISARTVSGQELTVVEQEQIIDDVIEKYKSISIIPEFVNPEYIWLEIDVVAYYDPTLTTKSADTIRTGIVNAIKAYNNTDLQKFNRIFRQSAISRIVESTDPSITSTVPRVKMYRTITPVYDKDNTYFINVGNPFTAGSILSSGFYIKNNVNVCFIDDDSQGNLTLFTNIAGVRTNLRQVGTVNYDTGSIRIDALNIIRSVEPEFRIAITPSSADVISIYNQIVAIDESQLKVNMIVDETINGRTLVGNKFQFTSSRI